MANQYSSGAIILFTGTGVGNAPQLLGTCEGPPRMEVETSNGTISTDLTGPEIPLDFSFGGQMATISMVLTRWDNIVASRLETRPGPLSTNLPGFYNVSDVGTMIGLEGYAFPIWLRYLFASGGTSKAAYAAIPGGYHFLQCVGAGSWSIEGGAKPMKRQFIFRAWPMLSTTLNGATTANPTLNLYDNVMAAVSSLPIV